MKWEEKTEPESLPQYDTVITVKHVTIKQYVVYNISTEDGRRTAIDIAAYRYKEKTGTVKINCMTEIRPSTLGLDCHCMLHLDVPLAELVD